MPERDSGWSGALQWTSGIRASFTNRTASSTRPSTSPSSRRCSTSCPVPHLRQPFGSGRTAYQSFITPAIVRSQTPWAHTIVAAQIPRTNVSRVASQSIDASAPALSQNVPPFAERTSLYVTSSNSSRRVSSRSRGSSMASETWKSPSGSVTGSMSSRVGQAAHSLQCRLKILEVFRRGLTPLSGPSNRVTVRILSRRPVGFQFALGYENNLRAVQAE